MSIRTRNKGRKLAVLAATPEIRQKIKTYALAVVEQNKKLAEAAPKQEGPNKEMRTKKPRTAAELNKKFSKDSNPDSSNN